MRLEQSRKFRVRQALVGMAVTGAAIASLALASLAVGHAHATTVAIHMDDGQHQITVATTT